MSAAELLRGLDRAATAGEFFVGPNVMFAPHADVGEIIVEGGAFGYIVIARMNARFNGDNGNARCFATTRNLLPLLAGLVEALGDFMDPGKEDDVDANYQRVERAYTALNSAAAK